MNWYDDRGIMFNDAVFNCLCEGELIAVLTGGLHHPYKETAYSPIIDFDGDDVLRDFGAVGLMVSGLLFGYPLESTADLITHLGIY